MFGFEIEVLQFLESIRSDFLVNLFELITMLGEETVMILFIVVLWFAFDKRFAQRIFFATIASMGVNGIIKNIAKVQRPWTTGKVTCVRPETATGYSFPSGHTQNFTTWTSVIALRVKKWWASVIVGVLAVSVAFSRLLLGAHYPSDVVVGLALGVGIACLASYLFDKVKNTQKLYIGAAIILTVFAIFFMFEADANFKGFYKAFGMMWGISAAVAFEEKHAPLTYDVAWWKKLIRIVIGVALAFALKTGIKLLYFFDVMQFTYIMDAIRYFSIVFVVGGICPLIFKKLKI